MIWELWKKNIKHVSRQRHTCVSAAKQEIREHLGLNPRCIPTQTTQNPNQQKMKKKQQIEETLLKRQNEALALGKSTAKTLIEAMKTSSFMEFMNKAPKIVENSVREQLQRGETIEI